MASAVDETATVPAAPPSTLSKKLMELQIPTIQILVMTASRIFDDVGVPTVFPAIKTNDVNKPARV